MQNLLRRTCTPYGLGVRVVRGREDEVGFEPGDGSGEWEFLPVVWFDEGRED